MKRTSRNPYEPPESQPADLTTSQLQDDSCDEMRTSSPLLKEIERKLYTFAIGFVGLAIVVFFYGNFTSPFPDSALHSLLRSGVPPGVIVTAEALCIQLVGVVLSVPLLKATRYRLSFVDAVVVSIPPAFIGSLSFCDGFEARLLVPILAWPILHLLIFRAVSLRAIRSLVDDVPWTGTAAVHLMLSFALSFQFALLSGLMSGATFPLRVRIVYLTFLAGVSIALAARLKQHLLWVVVLAIGVFLVNANFIAIAAPQLGAILRCS